MTQLKLEKFMSSVDRRLAAIESKVGITKEWLSEDQVFEDYGLGTKTLQRMRKNHEVKYRSTNGRNFQYSKKSLESRQLIVA